MMRLPVDEGLMQRARHHLTSWHERERLARRAAATRKWRETHPPKPKAPKAVTADTTYRSPLLRDIPIVPLRNKHRAALTLPMLWPTGSDLDDLRCFWPPVRPSQQIDYGLDGPRLESSERERRVWGGDGWQLENEPCSPLR